MTKPIEVLRTGTFVDARGTKVEISETLLDELVTNFNAGAAGQDIPIDINHEAREAAGWLTGLVRDGDKLLATANWNETGKTLVGQGVYRYISATIDLARKVLRSISLTNFPAVKELAPVSLSAAPTEPEPGQVYVAISLSDATFISQGAPMADENIVDNQADAPASEPPGATPGVTPPLASNQPAQQPVDVAALEDRIRAAIAQQMRDEMTAMLTGYQKVVAAETAALAEQKQAVITQLMRDWRAEQDILAFSERITSTGRHAIPVKPDDLAATLRSLPEGARDQVRNLLATIAEAGTVDFSEVGTAAGKTQPKQTLDPNMAAVLRQYLSSGGTVAEFFAINADVLGAQAAYDLTGFTDKAQE